MESRFLQMPPNYRCLDMNFCWEFDKIGKRHTILREKSKELKTTVEEEFYYN